MTNMSDRILMSEQEVSQKCGRSIIRFNDTWTSSYIYYDSENDRFIEERYHEEYLDTGTIRDGCFPISDQELWHTLVKHCNDDGMNAYFKHRSHTPPPLHIEDTITEDEFREGMNALRQNEPWRLYTYERLGPVTLITTQENIILGVLGKADNYCFFFDPKSDVKRYGFHLWEEALAFALKRITFYYNNQIERDRAYQKQAMVTSPAAPKSFWDRFKRGRRL